MQTDSSSLDTLKDSLLSAVDADYNVIDAERVLEIISQLEKLPITRDQLQSTRLGREINTIRQKIDARKKSAVQPGDCPQSVIDIAQRAKRLLRSWQGLLNTSQTDTTPSAPANPPATPAPPPTPPVPPATNGETHDSPAEDKPRIILKVKINPSISSNSNTESNSKIKRKHDAEVNGLSSKRPKIHNEMPISPPAPISPAPPAEPINSLPRLKTTQQLLMEMQLSQPDVLSTQAPTVNAILQNQIIDESLHEPSKVDYSALHHGRETTNATTNPTYQKQIPLPTVISPTNSTGSSTKRSVLVRRPSTNTNWENGSSAGGSPVSPSSSSSSSIASTTSWPLPANIPEPPSSIPLFPKKKRRRKSEENAAQPANLEQSTPFSPSLETLCSSYHSVAELTEAHRQRILAEHDTRELEARPELLLVPLDQLAFVYERERTKEQSTAPQTKSTSLTTVDTFEQPAGLVALPFIDCPLEFDLVLDELVVQQPTMDM